MLGQKLQPDDIERRALALFERICDHPGKQRFRTRLLKREAAGVRARVEALERARRAAEGALPTDLPGELLEPIDPPDRAGPYRLTRLLGEGGMGQVWEGIRDDGLFEQRVAVKLIRPHLAQLAAAQFDSERRILARLAHPGIARLIDAGSTETGLPWFIMELVDGVPIDRAAEGLPLARRVTLFLAAADAVQFAHTRLVIHADLKPSNILVDGDGRVRLLDFGIARLVGADGVPATTAPLTRTFASPARCDGDPPSIADDVHALGVTLDLIAGADADVDLGAVIAKARAPMEAERYGSVAGLIADLERWRERLPVSAMPDSFGYRMRRFIARHRLGLAATIAAFVLLAGAAGVATANYLRAERARAEAVARFQDARAAARYLQYDVVDRLERLPDSLPLRADIAKVSQAHLDRLARLKDAPPDVRREAAEGLLRLANQQAANDRPSLGQADAARRTYAQADITAQQLTGPAGRRLLAEILIRRAWLESESFNDFNSAERLLDRADPLVLGSQAAAPELAGEFLAAMSSLRQWQGRYPEALAEALRAETAVPGDSDAALRTRARALGLQGDAHYYSEDTAAALATYRRQVATLEKLGARGGDDPADARRLNIARWNLSSTLVEGGRAAEALPIITRAAADAHAAARFQPRDAEAERRFIVLENVRAQALAALGRTDDAVAVLEANARRRRALWLAHPAETARLRDYAVTLQMLADVEADSGRTAPACARYADIAALADRLQATGRLSTLDRDTMLKRVRERQSAHCA